MIQFRLRFRQIADRLRSQTRRRIALRALWIGAVLPVLILIFTMASQGSVKPLSYFTSWLLASLAAGFLLHRSSNQRSLAADLDTRFGLDDLLLTASEVDRRGARTALESRLLEDAGKVSVELEKDPRLLGMPLRRELESLLGMVLLMAGLWLLLGAFGARPELSRLAGLPSPDGQIEGPGQGDGPGAGGTGMSEATSRLAGALGDHAAAVDIAKALMNGNTAAAARAARSLADRAAELSPKGREGLADALREAADALDPLNPGVAQDLRDAADAVEAGDAEEAAEGIEELARQIDQLNSQSPDEEPPDLELDAKSRVSAPAQRNAAEPARLDLDSSGGSGSPSGGRSTTREAGSRSIRSDVSADSPVESKPRRLKIADVESGPDPHRYPWQQRETLRRYFGQELGR